MMDDKELLELKQKMYLLGGHMFSTFAHFFIQDMEEAKKGAETSKETYKEIMETLEKHTK